MNDVIGLSLSHRDRLTPVAMLVAGGLGSRVDLDIDRIDDLQLALGLVLSTLAPDERAELEFEPAEHGVTCRIGGLGPAVREVLPSLERLVHHARLEGEQAHTITFQVEKRPAQGLSPPAA